MGYGRGWRCVTFVFDVPPVLCPAFPRCFVYRAGKKANLRLRRPCPERIRSYTTLYHDRLPLLSSPTQHTDSSFRHIASGLSIYLLRSLGIYTNTDRPLPSRRTQPPRSGHAKTGRHQQHDHNNTRRLDLAIRPLTNYYFNNDDTQRQVALCIKPGTSLIL